MNEIKCLNKKNNVEESHILKILSKQKGRRKEDKLNLKNVSNEIEKIK